MGWKFWKREPNPMDPQQLLAQARQAGPEPQHGPGRRPQDTVHRPQDIPSGGFQLTVEDVFTITGRGTVVTGRVTSGLIRVGEQVVVSRAGQQLGALQVTGVEMFRKTVNEARAGDNVGLMLSDVRRDQIERGDVLTN
ncbi:EF-Tu/IF-2/RF-3 family GTPase [Kribbella amoyensis]|uniref:EF-Tu/IF-2/RF-3 family GTPase n=1 Tax=Kribbella amoyensis TaxID=996641 RepID=UPI0011A35599|nr:EF-Tu/IF-2/RF-3 family GTPase [Kribbella amoyensis]